MAASTKYVIFLCILFTAASSIRYVDSSSSSVSTSMCRPQSNTFFHDLQFQCPYKIASSLPLEIDGESLDGALSSSHTNVYTAVLFYASSCPLSSGLPAKFAALSTMFPQIKHVMIEQSSAMPSVLSRYEIHSLPSILMVNRKSRPRYQGRKDLSSLVDFYKRITGLDPIVDLTDDQGNYSDGGHIVSNPWKGNSLKEILMREPYLVSSVLFMFLRVFLYFFPSMISCLMSLWATYIPHLNIGSLRDPSQLLGRVLLVIQLLGGVLHVIDMKRVWRKVKLCKTRNFHNRARSARVWASSLASVSLGEPSSARMVSRGIPNE
ncbi:5'-adenylylsulfate reductase-like 5 [Actinidia eriantha]|uniref:5'-adenylylsulfate reductase-like 5 n=1 Tax=Actinidia eriantha TaxID=165200 RepID=UPI002585DC72|nr:5'-adenylylsulfate reductase-like 5 [Actinidia eriantha]